MRFVGNVASCLALITIDSTRHRTMTLWPVWFNFGTYLLSFYMRAHWFLSGKHLGSRVCWRMLRPRFCHVWVCFTATNSIHAHIFKHWVETKWGDTAALHYKKASGIIDVWMTLATFTLAFIIMQISTIYSFIDGFISSTWQKSGFPIENLQWLHVICTVENF